MKKSTTQMTKVQLLAVIKQKDDIIAELNAKLDEMEHLAVVSQATPMDREASDMLESMRITIRNLEDQLTKFRNPV